MAQIDVYTQTDLDRVVGTATPDDLIVIRGNGSFRVGGSATVRACDSATVEACDSATVEARGSATVRAWGSATVRACDSATVRACDSATVRAWGSATVEARGSATVRAWGSATVRACDSATVEACDSATVEARGSATVEATPYVAVHKPANSRASITGGVLIEAPRLDSAEKWCEYHGLEVVEGVVTLYKAVNAEYQSDRGGDYTPGNEPVADSWEPHRECGHGLHFSPSPFIARAHFGGIGSRFVGCPVRVDEIAVHPEGSFSAVKCSAPRVAGPVFEVDIDGEPIGELVTTGEVGVMDKVEFFRDRKREWRWRLVSSNGRVIGASSEGYRWRSRCVENFERVTLRLRHTWKHTPRSFPGTYAVPPYGEFVRLVPR